MVSQYENGPDFQTPNEARIAELENSLTELSTAVEDIRRSLALTPGNAVAYIRGRISTLTGIETPPPPSGISAVPGEAVAWMHTLHMEGGQTAVRLARAEVDRPWGKPGIDFDQAYSVTITPLYARPAAADAGVREALTGFELRSVIYDALDLSEELRVECTDAVVAALSLAAKRGQTR
jgi:hypothetical protein